MLTTIINAIATLLSGTSLIAVAAPQGQPTYDQLRQQMAGQLPSGVTASDPIATGVAQWQALRQAGGNASFFDYANFMLAHPGWPGESAFRTAAERRLDAGGWSPGLAVSFFRRFPPQSGAAATRYAQALMATGQSGAAAEAARAAWARGALAQADEDALLTQFGGQLTPADHDRRIDMLLWQGATGSAARVLPLTSPAQRDLFAARLAFRTNAPDAATRAYAPYPAGDADAGYLADKATWFKTSGGASNAYTLLANRPALVGRPGSVDRWYGLLLETAKAAAAEGRYDLAYRIAARVDDAYAPGTIVSAQSYGERDKFTDLTWLAGQTAMKQLGRPADAISLFESYSRGSRAPQVQSKGLFWAGRAAQAAGRATNANGYYQQVASGYADQFYGQLGAERLGLPQRAPVTVADRPVDAAARTAFYNREVVRAAQYLGQIGDYQTQSLFVRQIANDATTDSDHALANQLAIALNRPDLGVMVGRSALQNGLSDYRASGYPSVQVPADKQGDFTIIHAIARQESQFDRAAVSSAGARGLMQLMPGTAREQAGKIGLSYDPNALTTDTQYNINLGSSYFQRMYGIYGSYPMAVAAYNAGPGNVNKWLRLNGDPRTGGVDMIDWIEAIPFYETKNYVQRVLENAVVYDLLNPQRARSNGNARLSWYLGTRAGS
jgi:soluble lytic murein transglycosylase